MTKVAPETIEPPAAVEAEVPALRRFIVFSDDDDNPCVVIAGKTPIEAADKLVAWMQDDPHTGLARFQKTIYRGKMNLHELPAATSGVDVAWPGDGLDIHVIRLDDVPSWKRGLEEDDLSPDP